VLKWLQIVQLALMAIRRNVFRSALTTLGIIIGVGAVITMMEIGGGSSASIQKSIASMGANTLMVMPGAAASGGISFGAGSTMTLTPGDAAAIAVECPSVLAAAPVVRMKSSQIIYGNRNWNPMEINGTTASFRDVRDWPVVEGSAFEERDVRNAARVCLIGPTLAKQLFDKESPVGKEIRIQNVGVRVVGVLDKKGANMMGRDQDDIVLLPWTTVKFRLSGSPSASGGSSAGGAAAPSHGDLYPGSSRGLFPAISATRQKNSAISRRFITVDQITVAAKSAGDVPAAVEEISRLLRDRHHLEAAEDDDFNIRNMAEITKMMSATTNTMTSLLLVVAMLSLLVGGVGIMNIMLVSVTERTKEIGLRMAVGAKARDILFQFLTEAVVLCLFGGAMGIALGRGASMLVTSMLRWPTQVSIPTIVVAVAVSAFVGILFGFYPAWKASRLDPIEALRYE